MSLKVNSYFNNLTQWQEELEALRLLILEFQLTEELKWNTPCYTFKGKNIVLLGGFKNYCSLTFFKGSLLTDLENILVVPGENTNGPRVIRFTNVQEIYQLKDTLQSYLYEAIEVEKSGQKMISNASEELVFPEELLATFKENPDFEAAFKALTPGRQRGYNLHFSAGKQSTTRTRRIEKYLPLILNGFGLADCTCGHSKRMPGCDGSHKYL